MKPWYKKWWVWAIIIVIVLAIAPVWCTTYYLPDQATQSLVERQACGPIWMLFLVY